MEHKHKRLDIDELRLQRERMRRIAVGVLLVTVVLILASCQGLMPRDAAAAAPQQPAPPQPAPAQVTVHARFGPVGAAAQAHTLTALAAEGKADLTARRRCGAGAAGQERRDAGAPCRPRLLDADVRIFEMEHGLMHAKTAVIVLGDDFGREMEAMFAREREASFAIDATTWSQRPWPRRALEQTGRLAERWL